MLGITFSTPEDLAAWREELGLATPLLSDASREVALRYGAADDASQAKAARVSVLVGADGTVEHTWASPDPATHADAVLAWLDER